MGNVKSFCCCLGTASDGHINEDCVRILGYENISDGKLLDKHHHEQQHRIHDHDDQPSSFQTQFESMSITSSQADNNQLSNVYSESYESQKIYQRMSKTLIDIAHDESMIIQPAESMERQKFYQAKLAELKNPLEFRNYKIIRNHQQIEHQNTHSTQQFDRDNSPLRNLGAGPSNSTVSPMSKNQVSSSATDNTSAHSNQGCELISHDDVEFIRDISLRTVDAVKNIRIRDCQPIYAHFRP